MINYATAVTELPRRSKKHRLNYRRLLVNIVKYAVLTFVTLIILAPSLTAVLGGIRTTGEFLAEPFGLPKQGIQWQNFERILTSSTFWNAFGNSLLLTTGVTVIGVTLSTCLAFVFSRMQFLGKNFLFNVLSLGLLFPLVVAILPIFIQIRQLGLINSLWGVILPMVAFSLPGSVVILRSFFMAIPTELEDAAYIDGCSTLGFFRFILIPMARPAIAAVATLQIIAAWNEYFLPLLVLNDPKLWPLPLGIMQFQGQYGSEWALIMAYITILIIPVVIFYIFTQRFIVTGLTGGELKG
ncbi:MAG: thiamine ABC transporter ATP-binding protein [Candidatus Thermofonsia Clade 1 bacterium]|uniref:Thiamine ABC transporter ATP-binding protein n=1 Tax=Candidatus Thermofonsia Clade 1 bacterium TaxID=2364210 RepID=A0A2M8P0S6_9CHLR|nr:MAG: thiamine ABC transporter ATP-binding protein [Candidatus Thermofonsia Clade 1 bacterium]